MRDKYIAECQAGGDALTNGFGHLNSAAAELIVEAVRDVELTPAPPELDDADREPRCPPQNRDALCASVATLLDAASSGCVDRTKQLLSKEGIDSRNGSESAALDAAIRFGDEAEVKLLLDAGAPVNPAKFSLWPPLAEAAHGRKIGIMKMLLAAGANVDVQDRQGSYLANYGCFNTSVMKVLLEAGANPNATNDHGETALMRASGYGYRDAIKLLIANRADVNLKDNDGHSALMHAAAGKYVDAIPYLLANGADLPARDLKGDTALDIARQSKNEVAIELLAAAIKKHQP